MNDKIPLCAAKLFRPGESDLTCTKPVNAAGDHTDSKPTVHAFDVPTCAACDSKLHKPGSVKTSQVLIEIKPRA